MRYGYYYHSANEIGIVRWKELGKNTDVIGPYDSFTKAKKALIESLRCMRDDYNVGIVRAKKLTLRKNG